MYRATTLAMVLVAGTVWGVTPSIGLAHTGQAGPAAGEQPAQAEPYRILWSMGGIHGRNLAMSEVPVAAQARIVFPGIYPHQGPQILDTDHTFMTRHLDRVARDVLAMYPNPETTGYAVIDYESWWPAWDANPDNVKQAWRNHINTHFPGAVAGRTGESREAVYRETFEDRARTYFVLTIRECKRLRPNLKWGYYAIPFRRYWDWFLPGGADRVRAMNDAVAYLYDEMDAVFPSIYQFYRTREQGGENTPEANAQYIRMNVREALRMAGGKPVYPFVWPQYHPNGRPGVGDFDMEWLNDINLDHCLRIPREEGAAGVVIWGWLPTPELGSSFQTYLNEKLGPRLIGVTSSAESFNVNYRMDMLRRNDRRLALVSAADPGALPEEPESTGRQTAVAGFVPEPPETELLAQMSSPPAILAEDSGEASAAGSRGAPAGAQAVAGAGGGGWTRSFGGGGGGGGAPAPGSAQSVDVAGSVGSVRADGSPSGQRGIASGGGRFDPAQVKAALKRARPAPIAGAAGAD